MGVPSVKNSAWILFFKLTPSLNHVEHNQFFVIVMVLTIMRSMLGIYWLKCVWQSWQIRPGNKKINLQIVSSSYSFNRAVHQVHIVHIFVIRFSCYLSWYIILIIICYDIIDTCCYKSSLIHASKCSLNWKHDYLTIQDIEIKLGYITNQFYLFKT